MRPRKLNNLALDYINGEDIEEDALERLEDDSSFMAKVIKISKDKNFYNLCSENVKNNPNFIKTLIEIFPEDVEFLEKVTSEYMDKAPETINKIELQIMLSEVFKKSMRQTNINYKVKLQALYLSTMEKVQETIETLDEYTGSRFLIIESMYPGSEIIKNFFAKKILFDIFYEESEYTLEELLHIHIKDKKEITDEKLNEVLLSVIKEKDESLACYVKKHVNLLAPFLKELKRVSKNWDYYMNDLNQRRIEFMHKKIDELINENWVYEPYHYSVLSIVLKELNLDEIFIANDPYYEMIYNKKAEEEEPLSLQALDYKRKIMNIVKNLFKVDYLKQDSLDDEYTKEKDTIK